MILLDHHMPGEDGLHFAQSIHERLEQDHCPVILISSGATPLDSEQCQKLRIGRCMSKPVIASELLNEMLRQFGDKLTAPAAPTTSVSDVPRIAPRRVLLVEDNEINRRVAIGLLRSRGHQVAFAENGREALEKLATEEFDVVLMDMQMPVMDGYEATRQIRARADGNRVTIVALTANAMQGDREKCLAAGMNDYISKPTRLEDIDTVLRRAANSAQQPVGV